MHSFELIFDISRSFRSVSRGLPKPAALQTVVAGVDLLPHAVDALGDVHEMILSGTGCRAEMLKTLDGVRVGIGFTRELNFV